MVRLARSGDPAHSGSGSAPSVASRACRRSLEQSLPACLSVCPVHRPDTIHSSTKSLSSTSSCFVQDGQPSGGSATAALDRGLAGRSIVGGCYPLLLPWRDLADGWEWRQPFPSDRFASASPSWFVLPWPRVNAESPPSTTPEDPSVRLVWNLPQSVRPQTLLQDNPSLESGRPSLGLSAHSSMPEPPPAAALASPTRRVNLSLPPPVRYPSVTKLLRLGSLTSLQPPLSLSTLLFFPQGWPLSLSLHPSQRFSDASPFTRLHVLVTRRRSINLRILLSFSC